MDDLKRRFPIYSRLIRLYPHAYSETYGDEMLQTLADMLDDAPSWIDRSAVWIRTTADLPVTLSTQHIIHLGGTMTNQIPTYIKRSAYMSAALLVPFFGALIANGLDKVLYNHTLLYSWLWSMPWLALWVLYLPLLALGIAVTTLTIDLLRTTRDQRSRAKLVIGMRRTWPALLVGACALFIVAIVFGHDSSHCIIGNPVRELQHWHYTIQCIEQR